MLNAPLHPSSPAVKCLILQIMKTGIIVAMEKELALLLPNMEDCSHTSVNGFTFHSGRIGTREVVVMQCGIGKVNAAVGALTLIDTFHPSIVINTGVAGGTGHDEGKPGIGELFLAREIAYHDVWCGPGTERGEAAGCPARFSCPLPEDFGARLGAKEGLLASGDIFVSEPDDLARIKALYPEVAAVDMESAAIAQVCHLKDVPFVCMRVISDTPGDGDNISQYENFWTDAPARTFAAIRSLLQLIS